ncbi:MAG: type 1 glutamine amidotransferase [Pseudomonadota bacterium]
MTKILIVDSNTVDANALNHAIGYADVSEIFASALRGLNPALEITITHPYSGVAADPAPFDGVVFTGSAVDWNTDDARAAPLAQAMRAAFAARRPTFGSCNGMQLAASVLGGSTGESRNGREDGLARAIARSAAGRAHPMLAARDNTFSAPCIHRDEVIRLPDGAVLLAGNAHSRVQAFAYAQDGIDFWGVQYHPEFSLAFIAEVLRARGASPEDAAAQTSPALDDHARLSELRAWLAHIA